jgi:hypothetical protein
MLTILDYGRTVLIAHATGGYMPPSIKAAVVTFESIEQVLACKRDHFPFKLATTTGQKTYLGTFRRTEDLVRKRREIEASLATHKKLKPIPVL